MDNVYLRTGYRKVRSKKDAVLSIFQQHNETLNIWTHFLGAAIFLYLSIVIYKYQSSSRDLTRRLKTRIAEFYNSSSFKRKFMRELSEILAELKHRAEEKRDSLSLMQG